MQLSSKNIIRYAEMIISAILILGIATASYLLFSYKFNTTANFKFENLEVVYIKDRPFLRLQRTLDRNMIGMFLVELVPSNKDSTVPACTAVASPDLFAVRNEPFISRFLERFSKYCIEHLTPGVYDVTVEYNLKGYSFVRQTRFVLTAKAIKLEREIKGLENKS
jgi:hypothetical protein